jgi:hypothetical protein
VDRPFPLFAVLGTLAGATGDDIESMPTLLNPLPVAARAVAEALS